MSFEAAIQHPMCGEMTTVDFFFLKEKRGGGGEADISGRGL